MGTGCIKDANSVILNYFDFLVSSMIIGNRGGTNGNIHAPVTLLPSKEPPGLLNEGAGWTPLKAWTWRIERSLVRYHIPYNLKLLSAGEVGTFLSSSVLQVMENIRDTSSWH